MIVILNKSELLYICISIRVEMQHSHFFQRNIDTDHKLKSIISGYYLSFVKISRYFKPLRQCIMTRQMELDSLLDFTILD